MSKYYFIVNPASGRGKGYTFGKKLELRLASLDLDFQLTYTQKPLHAKDLAAKAVDHSEIIVVVGGDGTMQEVLNGMYGSKAALGLLPVGSGNDFARAVPLPVSLDKSLEVLLRGKRKKIDLARANDIIYHNGVGVGFDAWAVDKAMKIKHLRGNAIYLYSVLYTLISYKPANLELTINGQLFEHDYFLLTIANGVSLGGGFHLTPNAKLDDGLLDICVIQNMPKLQVLKNLLKVYSGTHTEDPRVDIIQSTTATIRSESGFAAHADGELLSLNMKELNIEILPEAVELIC